MKVLVCQLIYGDRPHNILIDNELKAGYDATFVNINTEGIANAMNEGVDSQAAIHDNHKVGLYRNNIKHFIKRMGDKKFSDWQSGKSIKKSMNYVN